MINTQNIRLLLGDCMNLMKSLPYESVDAIVTDPPYGILKGHKIETDLDIQDFFNECYRVLKPNSFIVYFGMQPTITSWNTEAFKLFNYKNEVIWYKRQTSNPMGIINKVFENIMMCVKGKRKINNVRRPYMDVKESLADVIGIEGIKRVISYLEHPFKRRMDYDEAIAYLNANSDEINEFYIGKNKDRKNDEYHIRAKNKKKMIFSILDIATKGLKPQNLVSFMPHNKQRFDNSGKGLGEHNVKHPTVKPIQLIEYLLDLTTNEGDLILDPFMGSGTTGIACHNLSRRFIGMELHQEYFDIAQSRILS